MSVITDEKRLNIELQNLLNNIHKLSLLRPNFFKRRILNYYQMQIKTINQYPDVSNQYFRIAVYNIFLLLIKILDDSTFHVKRSFYSKVFKSFKSKYAKRIKLILDDELINSIVYLLIDFNHDLRNRIFDLKRVYSTLQNITDIPYGVETNLNTTNAPVSEELEPYYKHTRASSRFVNSPINYRAPTAKSVFATEVKRTIRKTKKSPKGIRI